MEATEILTTYAQEGFDVVDADEETVIAKFIEKEKEVCPVELYRGIMVDEDYAVEVGDVIEFENLFASFDEDIERAKEFATRKAYGVILVLDGAEGLPVYMHTDAVCDGEQEWLIPDAEYVVTRVDQEDDLTTVYIEEKE